jgi:hypothetical protein
MDRNSLRTITARITSESAIAATMANAANSSSGTSGSWVVSSGPQRGEQLPRDAGPLQLADDRQDDVDAAQCRDRGEYRLPVGSFVQADIRIGQQVDADHDERRQQCQDELGRE